MAKILPVVLLKKVSLIHAKNLLVILVDFEGYHKDYYIIKSRLNSLNSKFYEAQGRASLWLLDVIILRSKLKLITEVILSGSS